MGGMSAAHAAIRISGRLEFPGVDKLRTPLVVMEVVISVLLLAGVLIQTPKATGLGGSIGGGGDGGLGGGYRTRRGLERQIYWTTWVLVAAFLAVSVANIVVFSKTAH
jgi:protein translocase SecG subunit